MRQAIEQVIAELTESRDKAKMQEDKPVLTAKNNLEHMYASGARMAMELAINKLKGLLESETQIRSEENHS